MVVLASSRYVVPAGRPFPDYDKNEVEKRGHSLSLGQIVLLLQQVLPRRELTKRQTIAMVKHQLARNQAATRSHQRRHGTRRSRPKAPT